MKNGEQALVIDFYDDRPQLVGYLASLQYLYEETCNGMACLTSKLVRLDVYAKRHIKEKHLDRTGILPRYSEYIRLAVERPNIVSRDLSYKDRMKHWTMTLVSRVVEEPGRYVVVVVSLANAPGEPESEYHQVVTIYLARHKDFYARGPGGEEVCKRRWLEVDK